MSENGTPTGGFPAITITSPEPNSVTIADSVTFTREHDAGYPGIGWELAKNWALVKSVATATKKFTG